MTTAEIVAGQRRFFETGVTKEVGFRMAVLKKLRRTIQANEKQIAAALAADLGKAAQESYMTETGIVLEELGFMLGRLGRWSAGRRVRTPLAQFPGRSYSRPEPYGVVLVLAPWNYPFQLVMAPLIGALAAGNCVVLKPSADAPATARLLEDMVTACFAPEYVAVVQGGRTANTDLLAQRFDYIFFTGGVRVGQVVMAAAARHLTPVTLELGGKSPCIIDETADIRLAAKRLAFGKFLNAGQTCVAPDYVLVQAGVRERLIRELDYWIRRFFGEEPLACPDYPRIVNQKHFDRLVGLMAGERAPVGGRWQRESLRIAPTVLTGITAESPIMQEEIFGPVLPVLPYRSLDEALDFVRQREKPLALYFFSKNRHNIRRVLGELSFGGGCINDTIIHLATTRLAFGGVGMSGMGAYHGKASFDTFSHYKSVVHKSDRLDLPMRYHPYTEKSLALIKKFMN